MADYHQVVGFFLCAQSCHLHDQFEDSMRVTVLPRILPEQINPLLGNSEAAQGFHGDFFRRFEVQSELLHPFGSILEEPNGLGELF
jgi:hypothetical protein